MACNKWIPAKLTANAAKVPLDQRIEFMVSNALQPIPEHKFDVIYFYLFNQPFKPSLFGRYLSITEVIASIPNLYRTISKDGRPFIHCYSNHKEQAAGSRSFQHSVPKWAVVENDKTALFGARPVSLSIFKEGAFVRDIALSDTLMAEPNRSHIVFGRDPSSDFCVQHPSISRHHSLFQFGSDGTVFLFDLSTHGTLLNHKEIPKRKYVELKHGDKIRFGHSSRTYVLSIGKGADKENAKNAMNAKRTQPDDQRLNEMQQTIARLTKDLDSAKKKVATKSNQVASLMLQMECLKVTKSRKQETSDSDEEQNTESEQSPERVSKIKGIDFVAERHDLSKLTVVRLRYYTERNGINVGKVRKADLVKIIANDIKKHFDV